MISIRNEYCTLYCQENGESMALVDMKRGTRWIFDYESWGYESKTSDGKGEKTNSFIPLRAEPHGDNRLRVFFKAAQETIEMHFIMKPNYLEVQLPADPIREIEAVALPGTFIPAGEEVEFALPIMQGMLWKGRGEPFDWRLEEARHGGFSMPFVGYMSPSGGMLVTSETRDDLELHVGKSSEGKCWAHFLQTSSLGSMRYDRAARIYLTDSNIVSLAKTYRKKVKEQGKFKNWEDKIAERPALERLFGSLMCFIGYCQDDLDYANECKKLKDYGFDRALVYPARFNTYNQDILMGGLPPIQLSKETTAKIKQLGYDIAPWSWINEALDDGSEYVKQIYRKNQEGKRLAHWAIDEQRWYLCCTSFMESYQQRANQGQFSDMTWDHFDVITCATNGECHALDHPAHKGRPLSKTEDREFIKKLLVAGQNKNRAVSSESFNDAYAMEYDLGSVKAFPMFNQWPFWPIPLTMLVYHDSMIHSWWEMHSYNNPHFGRLNANNMYEYGGGRTKIQSAMDALMGCPPDVFPFGSQYMWTGKDHETIAYRYRFEDPSVQLALKEALPVARLHKRIGKQEMIHFKILTEDGNVQETTFADGTTIIANFSSAIRSDITGYDPLPAESWREVK